MWEQWCPATSAPLGSDDRRLGRPRSDVTDEDVAHTTTNNYHNVHAKLSVLRSKVDKHTVSLATKYRPNRTTAYSENSMKFRESASFARTPFSTRFKGFRSHFPGFYNVEYVDFDNFCMIWFFYWFFMQLCNRNVHRFVFAMITFTVVVVVMVAIVSENFNRCHRHVDMKKVQQTRKWGILG